MCFGLRVRILFVLMLCNVNLWVRSEDRQLSWANGNTNISEHLLLKGEHLIYIPHTFFKISPLMLCGANVKKGSAYCAPVVGQEM